MPICTCTPWGSRHVEKMHRIQRQSPTSFHIRFRPSCRIYTCPALDGDVVEGAGLGDLRGLLEGPGPGPDRDDGVLRPARDAEGEARRLITEQSGNMLQVGIFLDFVRLATRTPHGVASYVRGARRNRIDRHGGGIERLTPRTLAAVTSTVSVKGYPPETVMMLPSGSVDTEGAYLITREGGNVSQVVH